MEENPKKEDENNNENKPLKLLNDIISPDAEQKS